MEGGEGHPRGAIRFGRVTRPNESSLEFAFRFRCRFIFSRKYSRSSHRLRWSSLARPPIPDARFVKLASSALNRVYVSTYGRILGCGKGYDFILLPMDRPQGIGVEQWSRARFCPCRRTALFSAARLTTL